MNNSIFPFFAKNITSGSAVVLAPVVDLKSANNLARPYDATLDYCVNNLPPKHALY